MSFFERSGVKAAAQKNEGSTDFLVAHRINNLKILFKNY